MKRLKFGLKLFCAALPMIIYIVCFIKYEPYNYFGLQAQAKRLASPLQRVREFMRNPAENIVLGDSRMNHVDLNLAEELTGEKWGTLATGGQKYSLTYDLYEWAKTKTDIKNVIMDVSFYQMLPGGISSGAEPVLHIADHPLDYIVTRDYVIETFSPWLRMRTGGALATAVSEEGGKAENTSKYRDDLVAYAVNNIYPSCVDYHVDERQMEYVLAIIQDVRAGGGTVKILIPVVQESIWEYVIIPLNIESYMEEYKSEIAKYADVYDMEWLSELSKQQDLFADGFHFNNERTYQIYTRNLLSDTGEYVKVWKNVQGKDVR